MDRFLDIFFFAFHCSLILWNLFAWIPRRTRRWNLLSLGLTAFSWFFLGIWYGWGYCPCTDWHWQVRARLGYHDLPVSYIKFLIDSLTGWNSNPRWVDTMTLVLFFVALAASLAVNVRDFVKRRAGSRQQVR